ncbi:hypothetical protein [Caballeronia cordobensis]|uniref:hypothetical protein n=1 Tax=Caballeronia cordobensis TaxID=1353886 RepID=UPI0006AD7FBB|nr:hypothetical protein [Caballeronia cordobensis]
MDKTGKVWLAMIALVAFTCVILGLAIAEYTGLNGPKVQIEIIKLLFQVATVTTLGGFISFATSQYQRSQQHRDKEDERERERAKFQRGLLNDLMLKTTKEYSEVKRIRRAARAHAVTGDVQARKIRIKDYDSYMLEISDAQLELENIRREVINSGIKFEREAEPASKQVGGTRASPASVVPTVAVAENEVEGKTKVTSIDDNLKEMEKYLNKMVGEFEANRSILKGEAVPVSDLPRFEEFLAPAAISPMRAKFYDQFSLIQTAFRQKLASLSE